MKTVSIKHTYWDIAADIYFPDDFNSEKKVSCHYQRPSNWKLQRTDIG